MLKSLILATVTGSPGLGDRGNISHARPDLWTTTELNKSEYLISLSDRLQESKLFFHIRKTTNSYLNY